MASLNFLNSEKFTLGSYALITGASRGLGRSFALQLARKGYNLLVTARSENDLIELKKEIEYLYPVKVNILALDLSLAGAAKKIKDYTEQQELNVSILVNNAGYGLWGSFDELAIDEQLNMLQLNINAPVELCYYILPILKRQERSFILNVASTAAYQAVPTLGAYSASKAFVLSFTRALRFEIKRHKNISVSCVCPGPVETGFAERAGLRSLGKLADKLNMQPDEVVKIALEGLFTGRAEIIPGLINKITAWSNRFFCKNFVERTAAGLYKKK